MQAATVNLILLATIIEKKKKEKKTDRPRQLSFAPITFIPRIYCKYSVIKLKLHYG